MIDKILEFLTGVVICLTIYFSIVEMSSCNKATHTVEKVMCPGCIENERN